MNSRDYTFRGLCSETGAFDPEPELPTSLCYLISCVTEPNHLISDPTIAKRILSWLYDIEEQAQNADHLLAKEKFFDRYFRGGFFPKTPCLVTYKWSPVSALLESGNNPLVLNRESKARAAATGIWNPKIRLKTFGGENLPGHERLFWNILEKVSTYATGEGLFINLVAAPGWSYEHARNSLPTWPVQEIEKSGRLIWNRTIED